MNYFVCTVTTTGKVYTVNFIEHENAERHFFSRIVCEDCKSCVMINAKDCSTVNFWEDGEMVIYNNERLYTKG